MSCKSIEASYKLSLFYKTVAVVSSSVDFKWIWQLYYLSSDFAAAVALRYGGCHDSSFRDSFGQHTAEEVEHPKDLADWMRDEFKALKKLEINNF